MAVVEDESSSISMVNLVPDDSAFDKLASCFMAFRDNSWIIVRIIGYPRQYPTFDPDDFGYGGS
ncbi:MAG: hypothetical protein MRQ13_04290 [Candidatus Midichloria sp.]|nr:hypothetical protein [Candidatus Midichloria sp.]